MVNVNLKKRELYLQQMKAFQDTEMIKIINIWKIGWHLSAGR